MDQFDKLSESVLGLFEKAKNEAAKAIEAVKQEAKAAVAVAKVQPPVGATFTWTAEKPAFKAPESLQVTVRGGGTLHFQAGKKGTYRKGDFVNPSLAAAVNEEILHGNGNVATSLYGSSTLYLKLTAIDVNTAALPSGKQISVPSGLLS